MQEAERQFRNLALLYGLADREPTRAGANPVWAAVLCLVRERTAIDRQTDAVPVGEVC